MHVNLFLWCWYFYIIVRYVHGQTVSPGRADVSLSVIRSNNSHLHRQCLGRRCQTKKERNQKERNNIRSATANLLYRQVWLSVLHTETQGPTKET